MVELLIVAITFIYIVWAIWYYGRPEKQAKKLDPRSLPRFVVYSDIDICICETDNREFADRMALWTNGYVMDTWAKGFLTDDSV